jgi:hypothetical protein
MIAGQNLAGEGLCYVVIMRFCRDIGFVAFTRFFGLGLTQILRILVKFCADIQGVPKKWCIAISLLPGHCDNLQQSGSNSGHIFGLFCELFTH